MTLPSTFSERNSRRAFDTFWWWTWASLIFLYAVMYVVTFGHLVLGNEAAGDSTAVRVYGTAQVVLLVVSALTAFLTSLRFRSGWPDAGGIPWRTVALVGAAPLLLALSSWGNDDGGLAALLPLWLAVSHVASLTPRPARWRLFWAGLGLVVAIAAVYRLLHSGAPWWIEPASAQGTPENFFVIVYGALIPPVVLGSVWWWDAIVRLQRGRAAERDLAVARERLRIAGDLHDIQGHHLQVIALQAELAERLVERDPAGALEQIGKVRQAAAEAMGETRAVVSGLRRVGFATEVENAADVLSAAGIDCRVDGWGHELTGAPRQALGWVIREAATNILRHAQATRAELRLVEDGGWVTLTVENDGVAPAGPGPAAPAPAAPRTDGAAEASASPGRSSGLLGLRRRIEQLGGRFEAGPAGDGFVVTASVPAHATEPPQPFATGAAPQSGRVAS